MDEIQHLKISFGALNVPAEMPDDRYTEWLLKNMPYEKVVFALVKQGEKERWEVVDTTARYRIKSSLYQGFKSGALYEVESGQRTVHGKRLKAEKYLDFLDALSCNVLDLDRYQIRATVELPEGDGRLYRNRVNGLEWNHSDAVVTHANGLTKIDFAFRDALSWLFIESIGGAELTLKMASDYSTAKTYDLF